MSVPAIPSANRDSIIVVIDDARYALFSCGIAMKILAREVQETT